MNPRWNGSASDRSLSGAGASGVGDPYVALAHARLVAWLGIDPSRGGIARAIERHVAERVQALGRPSVAEFGARLDAPGGDEGRALVTVATVPHSWLFRDPTQLEAIVRRLASATSRAQPRRVANVWVAGCANGEEAYTIAALAHFSGVPIRILATDVNEAALGRARRGVYDAWAARDVPTRARSLFVETDGQVVVADALRDIVRFAHHSLVSAPPLPPSAGAPSRDASTASTGNEALSPMIGGWDAIVCRNVLIYFAADVAIGLVARMAGALATEGALVLGTSDVLAELPPDLVVASDMGRMVLARTNPASASRKQVRELAAPVPAPILSFASSFARSSSPSRALGTVGTGPASTSPTPAIPSASPIASALPAAASATFPTSPSVASSALSALPSTSGAPASRVENGADPFAALARGDDETALRVGLERLSADPLDAEASLLAGLALHARGDYPTAAERLRAAACLAPGAWVAWFYLALSWERLGCWDDARRAFRQVASAHGPGDDYPRGSSDLAATLRTSRARLVEVANRREHVLGPAVRAGAPVIDVPANRRGT